MFALSASASNLYTLPASASGWENGRLYNSFARREQIESSGLANNPAAEQNRVVATITATQNPKWRSTIHELVFRGNCNPDAGVDDPKLYSVRKGDPFFILEGKKMMMTVNGQFGYPFPHGTTVATNLLKKFYTSMTLYGFILSAGVAAGDPDSVGMQEAVCLVSGVHEVTNTGPDKIAAGGYVGVSPFCWSRETKDGSNKWLPIVFITDEHALRMSFRTFSLDSRDAAGNFLRISQMISDEVKASNGGTAVKDFTTPDEVDEFVTRVENTYVMSSRDVRHVPELENWARLELIFRVLIIIGGHMMKDPTAEREAMLNKAIQLALRRIKDWQIFKTEYLHKEIGGDEVDLEKALSLPPSKYESIEKGAWKWNDPAPKQSIIYVKVIEMLNDCKTMAAGEATSWYQRFFAGVSFSAAVPSKSFILYRN